MCLDLSRSLCPKPNSPSFQSQTWGLLKPGSWKYSWTYHPILGFPIATFISSQNAAYFVSLNILAFVFLSVLATINTFHSSVFFSLSWLLTMPQVLLPIKLPSLQSPYVINLTIRQSSVKYFMNFLPCEVVRVSFHCMPTGHSSFPLIGLFSLPWT